MRTTCLLPFLAAAPLAACGDDDASGLATTREVLASSPTFAIANAESSTSLHAELDRGSSTATADLAMAMTTGSFAVGAEDGAVSVDELTLAFGDVALPAAIFPAQLVLTDIHVHTGAALALPAYWSDDDDVVTASGPGTLKLDWSLRVAGQTYALGTQTLTDLGFTVTGTRHDARVRVALGVTAHGVMWSWADIVALGNLDLDVAAYAELE